MTNLSTASDSMPKLAPPGAGLPFIQRVLARYYFMPKYFRSTTWEQAQGLFDREGEKILKAVEGLSAEKLTTRVLVDPIQGLEDSSRYWSVAMTLEHLVMVGSQMANAIVALSQGHSPKIQVSTANFKPKGEFRAELAAASFREFMELYRRRMREEVRDEAKRGDSGAKLLHPWFGPLTAARWHKVAAVHHRVHRKQVEGILKGLSS